MSKVWFGVLISFTIFSNVFSASIKSCDWEAASSIDRDAICKEERSENLLAYNSCFDTLEVFKDSIGRVKLVNYITPLGTPDQESAEEACKDESNDARKRACMRMAQCTSKEENGELVTNCQAPSTISEMQLNTLGMPFDKNFPIAFLNGKALMGAEKIKEELCQGKDETCKGLVEIKSNDNGFIIGSSLVKEVIKDLPKVSKAKKLCGEKYTVDTFNYNYCVRELRCPEEGECKFPDEIKEEDDTNYLGTALEVSCLDDSDQEGDVVSNNNDSGSTSSNGFANRPVVSPEIPHESCLSKKGRDKFLCYMNSLGQRPERLIEACSISQERYEDFLESLDERDGASTQSK